VVWLHSEVILVRDAEGRPRFWHGIALDITARKSAEESLADPTGPPEEALSGPRPRTNPPAG
jgi:hypothetical protein